MKISFVIPVYKKSPEIFTRCLDSLFGLSHKDIEVICVFDGPDPELEKIVDLRFGSVKKLVIEHGGAPKARNAGSAIATGDIVSCWDADCIAAPEMASVWVKVFNKYPKADFVYSGYSFTDHALPGFHSEPFDQWTLSKYNYISTMFPVRREKLVKWDESLEGLQDWDFFRTLVEAGCVGQFNEGFGFTTEPPGMTSISGGPNKVKERIEVIRKKHGDKDSDILVCAGTYKLEAIRIAKALNADYFWTPYWKVRDYKLIMSVGFNPDDMNLVNHFFSDENKTSRKVIYWMGYDAEMIYRLPFNAVKFLVKNINEVISFNFCQDKRTRDFLEELGIKAEILPLPRENIEPIDTMPEKFRVLVFSDDSNKELTDSIISALPDVDIQRVFPGVNYSVKDFSAVMQFTGNQRLEVTTMSMLFHGRHVISNVEQEYAGYVDTSRSVTEVKDEIINKIRKLEETNSLNKEAQEFYLDKHSRSKFIGSVKTCIATPLELVS